MSFPDISLIGFPLSIVDITNSVLTQNCIVIDFLHDGDKKARVYVATDYVGRLLRERGRRKFAAITADNEIKATYEKLAWKPKESAR